jgi:GNAT superfamily N-acetyltransferase
LVYAPEVGALCVVADDAVLAAAQWMRLHSQDPYVGEPFRHDLLVQWIVAEPDCPGALEALLSDLEKVALDQACVSIRVDARFSFGLGWLGLSGGWDHLIDGLWRSDYEIQDRWSILVVMPTPGLPSAALLPQEAGSAGELADTNLIWRIDERAGEWTCVVRKGEIELGECQAWAVPRHLQPCAATEDWITIEWIDVDDDYRRQGLGRYLMATQLAFQAERGKRCVFLWCDAEDRQARAFHRALGFSDAFESVCWVKVLT